MDRIHFFDFFHTGLLLHGLHGLKTRDNAPMGTLPPGKNDDWLVAVRALHCPGVLVLVLLAIVAITPKPPCSCSTPTVGVWTELCSWSTARLRRRCTNCD
jgi:hypothetical protein